MTDTVTSAPIGRPQPGRGERCVTRCGGSRRRAVSVGSFADPRQLPAVELPMFTHNPRAVAGFQRALGVTADGDEVVLSPQLAGGTVEVIHAAQTFATALRQGRGDEPCAEIAERVAEPVVRQSRCWWSPTASTSSTGYAQRTRWRSTVVSTPRVKCVDDGDDRTSDARGAGAVVPPDQLVDGGSARPPAGGRAGDHGALLRGLDCDPYGPLATSRRAAGEPVATGRARQLARGSAIVSDSHGDRRRRVRGWGCTRCGVGAGRSLVRCSRSDSSGSPRLPRHGVRSSTRSICHLGVLVLMAVLFPYPLFGRAFASMLPAERLLTVTRAGRGRQPRGRSHPPGGCWATSGRMKSG